MQCKSATDAELSAHRLLTTIRTTPVPIAKDQTVTLTVTLGLAQVGDHEELASALERADVALYKGKETGAIATSLTCLATTGRSIQWNPAQRTKPPAS